MTGNPEVSSAQRDACGAWIKSTMESFGYQANVQTWNHTNPEGSTVPVVSYVFRKNGSSARRVVIGAHYDSRETHGAEDNGTGVSLLLELAQRFASVSTNLTLEFAFWDGEELRGHAGAHYYLATCPDAGNILLYINLDSIGSGDDMYAYGGRYEGNTLVQAWGYNMAMNIASYLGIPLKTIPYISDQEHYKAPARTIGSDQDQFANRGIPYVYFEANAWIDGNGTEPAPQGRPYFYNSRNPAFASTGGQIIHTDFDDLDVLESIVPGRIRSHLADYSRIITVMLMEMTEGTPGMY